MLLIRNWLYAISLAAFSVSGLRAHDPFQTTLELQVTADGLEINATMSPASAAALLKTSEAISPATFAARRAEFTKAAPRLCTLLDAAGAIITPTRTIASLNVEGEVCLLFQYPAATNPDRVHAEFLATLSSGYFVGVTDRRSTPPRHGVLFRSRDTHSFAEAAASVPATPTAPASTPSPEPTASPASTPSHTSALTPTPTSTPPPTSRP